MVARNLSGCKRWAAHKADNLITACYGDRFTFTSLELYMGRITEKMKLFSYCWNVSPIMETINSLLDVRFRTWNVRSLYRLGSLMMVSRELSKYKLDLVGV
jgi:hypothetical protein